MRNRSLPLVVAIPLAVAAAASAFGQPAPPTIRELLRDVPTDARFVIAVDTTKLRTTPAVQEWMRTHQGHWCDGDNDASAFLQDSGLDPLRDVDRIVFAGSAGDGNGVALFAGRFDSTSLAAALSKRGAERVTVDGFTLYRLADEGHGRHPHHPLVHVGANLVIVGNEAAAVAALSGKAGVNETLAKDLASGRIDPKATLWMVADLAGLADRAEPEGDHAEGHGELRGVMAASRSLRRVSVQASLDDTVTISGDAVADSEENAELLRDALKGAVAAIRLESQDRIPELVDVLRGVTITQSGHEVRVSGSIPVAVIEELVEQHHEHRRHMAAGAEHE
jgi:hypothetical protein